jgi:hypothetical protein
MRLAELLAGAAEDVAWEFPLADNEMEIVGKAFKASQ